MEKMRTFYVVFDNTKRYNINDLKELMMSTRDNYQITLYTKFFGGKQHYVSDEPNAFSNKDYNHDYLENYLLTHAKVKTCGNRIAKHNMHIEKFKTYEDLQEYYNESILNILNPDVYSVSQEHVGIIPKEVYEEIINYVGGKIDGKPAPDTALFNDNDMVIVCCDEDCSYIKVVEGY